MALRGVRVLELAGLAPAPFCGMILADFGATVIRIDRTAGALNYDVTARGKKSVAINLKQTEGTDLVRKLSAKFDVILEPFRPGLSRHK
jgi:alpha-methylacyl-CoA racemase